MWRIWFTQQLPFTDPSNRVNAFHSITVDVVDYHVKDGLLNFNFAERSYAVPLHVVLSIRQLEHGL